MIIYIVIGIVLGLLAVIMDDGGFFKAWSIGILVGIFWPIVVLYSINSARKG